MYIEGLLYLHHLFNLNDVWNDFFTDKRKFLLAKLHRELGSFVNSSTEFFLSSDGLEEAALLVGPVRPGTYPEVVCFEKFGDLI